MDVRLKFTHEHYDYRDELRWTERLSDGVYGFREAVRKLSLFPLVERYSGEFEAEFSDPDDEGNRSQVVVEVARPDGRPLKSRQLDRIARTAGVRSTSFGTLV